MVKKNIVYRFETPFYPANILYVNLIKKYSCVNDCEFCGRPRTKKEIGKPNIYEKKAKAFLYLEESPSVKEVLEEIRKEIKREDTEIAFIGLGEPLIYLQKIIKIIKILKEEYPKVKIRIDTNGATKEINENPVDVAKRLEKAGLDEIRVSVNATDKKSYDELCRPQFKDSFNNLVKFVRTLNNSRIKTYASFVVNFNRHEKLKSLPGESYIKFAESLGLNKKNVILRNYMET